MNVRLCDTQHAILVEPRVVRTEVCCVTSFGLVCVLHVQVVPGAMQHSIYPHVEGFCLGACCLAQVASATATGV